jgi:hypothetical protein
LDPRGLPSINFSAIPCSPVSRILPTSTFGEGFWSENPTRNLSKLFCRIQPRFSLAVIEGSFVSRFETDGGEWAHDREALVTVRKEFRVLPDSKETGLAGKAELAEWLSPGQAAAELFLRPATLANWRTLGKGPPFHKFGRTVIYLRGDLDLWKRSQRHECDE